MSLKASFSGESENEIILDNRDQSFIGKKGNFQRIRNHCTSAWNNPVDSCYEKVLLLVLLNVLHLTV